MAAFEYEQSFRDALVFLARAPLCWETGAVAVQSHLRCLDTKGAVRELILA